MNVQELFREVYGTHAELDSVRFDENATDFVGDLAGMAGLADKEIPLTQIANEIIKNVGVI